MSYKGEELAAALRRGREDKGLSQRGLSARSGLTQSHISQIERGTLEPGLGTLIDLSRAIDLELVLVPKRLLPVVSGLIQGSKARAAWSPEGGQAALRQIRRGERRVGKLRELYGSSAHLDRIAESLQMLRRLPLRNREISQVTATLARLGQPEAGRPDGELLADIAATLQSVRHRVEDRQADRQRPAYAPDDDDEEEDDEDGDAGCVGA
ncbi:MAG: helix-turn-helix domain-containing protein [Alphaproteobacteria bacterium]|nr:helix-turn-helix domain-containing protein [Alphaproteobacteria bacterium]